MQWPLAGSETLRVVYEIFWTLMTLLKCCAVTRTVHLFKRKEKLSTEMLMYQYPFCFSFYLINQFLTIIISLYTIAILITLVLLILSTNFLYIAFY